MRNYKIKQKNIKCSQQLHDIIEDFKISINVFVCLCQFYNKIFRDANSETSKFKFYPDVGRQNNGSKDVHIQVPKSLDCLFSLGKKQFQGCG